MLEEAPHIYPGIAFDVNDALNLALSSDVVENVPTVEVFDNRILQVNTNVTWWLENFHGKFGERLAGNLTKYGVEVNRNMSTIVDGKMLIYLTIVGDAAAQVNRTGVWDFLRAKMTEQCSEFVQV